MAWAIPWTMSCCTYLKNFTSGRCYTSCTRLFERMVSWAGSLRCACQSSTSILRLLDWCWWWWSHCGLAHVTTACWQLTVALFQPSFGGMHHNCFTRSVRSGLDSGTACGQLTFQRCWCVYVWLSLFHVVRFGLDFGIACGCATRLLCNRSSAKIYHRCIHWNPLYYSNSL